MSVAIALEDARAAMTDWPRGPTLTLVPSENPIADAVRLTCRRTILVGMAQDVDEVVNRIIATGKFKMNRYRPFMPPARMECGLDLTSSTLESRQELDVIRTLALRPARSRPHQAIVIWPNGPRFRQRTSLCHLRETFWRTGAGIPAAYVLLHHDLALKWYEPPHWPGEYLL